MWKYLNSELFGPTLFHTNLVTVRTFLKRADVQKATAFQFTVNAVWDVITVVRNLTVGDVLPHGSEEFIGHREHFTGQVLLLWVQVRDSNPN